MITLLAFSTLPAEGPSVRPRVLAYRGALREAGIDLVLLPFLSERGFRGFYSTGLLPRTRKAVLGALGYAGRVRAILRARRADAVLVHREIVPRGNRRAVRALARRGLPIAYDLDDAIWLSPRDYVRPGETSRRRMTRVKDPAEVDDLIRAARVVLAGNPTIVDHARPLCDDVRLQPTPVDTDVFRPARKPPRERPLVGWIGSPTAAYCVRDLAPALARAAREETFDLLLVGAGERIDVPGVRVTHRDWTLAAEPGDFASLDVGIYPLPDNEWTRGKSGMKALQYMACGVPAVASPVGVTRDIVRDGETGALAAGEDEWVAALVRYLRDPALRAAHGEAGRARAVGGWSLRALAPGFVGAIRELLP